MRLWLVCRAFCLPMTKHNSLANDILNSPALDFSCRVLLHAEDRSFAHTGWLLVTLLCRQLMRYCECSVLFARVCTARVCTARVCTALQGCALLAVDDGKQRIYTYDCAMHKTNAHQQNRPLLSDLIVVAAANWPLLPVDPAWVLNSAHILVQHGLCLLHCSRLFHSVSTSKIGLHLSIVFMNIR